MEMCMATIIIGYAEKRDAGCMHIICMHNQLAIPPYMMQHNKSCSSIGKHHCDMLKLEQLNILLLFISHNYNSIIQCTVLHNLHTQEGHYLMIYRKSRNLCCIKVMRFSIILIQLKINVIKIMRISTLRYFPEQLFFSYSLSSNSPRAAIL